MDAKKRAGFIKACGKKRQGFSKGGLIRKIGNRKYFDAGGTVLSGPSSSAVNQNAVNPNTGVVGTIGNALGTNDQFQAGSALINPGTNTAQLNQAYSGAQAGLDAQGNLVNEIVPQVPTAINNQNAVAEQQLGIINGTGPNPALAELNQATGANVANQAALIAGARGSSVNPGLIAREAAQAGAGIQQQAVGQGATLEAQQQIAAGQNLAGLANQQVNQAGQAVTAQNTAQQNEQGLLQNANTASNNAAVGMQENVNNVNSATAMANQKNNQGLLGGVGSAVSSLTAGLLEKGGVVGKDGDHKEEHIKLAEMNAHSLAHGKKYAGGGPIVGNPLLNPSAPPAGGGGGNWAGQYFSPGGASDGPGAGAPAPTSGDSGYGSDVSKTVASGIGGISKLFASKPLPASGPGSQEDIDSGGLPLYPQAGFADGGKICPGPHDSHVANYLSGGGAVPAMVSPGEIYLSPDKVQKVIREGANPMKIGMKIPGKASKRGDSLKNDTVPMNLEEGGIVIPRHITSKMSPEKAELFVHRALARKKVRA